MEIRDILTIIDKVCEKEEIGNFQLRDGKFELVIEKGTGSRAPERRNVETPAAAARPRESVPAPETEDTGNCQVVKSPLVGTFYAAPAEDKPPYVTVGAKVSKGQILGIVEAMKLMNEIECEYDGIVEKILVKNGELVEYGKELFVISPEV